MKKKIVIISLILILYQILYPIVGNALTEKQSEYKKTSSSFFSDDITYEWEYFPDKDVMPYGVLTPSNASKMEKVPMILWLHGNNTITENQLKEYGIVSQIMKWSNTKTLQPFCAYVLCPHIPQKDADGYWRGAGTAKNVETILKNFIEEHNVDTNNIVIMGSSGGTFGVQYYASSQGFPEYFSKAVILSGYYFYSGSIDIPTKAFAGYTPYGEDPRVAKYLYDFGTSFGNENCHFVEGGHSDLSIFSHDDGFFMGLDKVKSECGIARQ